MSTDPALLEVSLRSTLTGLIDEQTARTPEAVAVVTADGPLTYAELAGRVRALAAHLRTLGVGPETVVGICAVRGAAMIVGVLAILRAGGAYLPLDPEYPADRLSYMLGDAQADLLLVHEPTAAAGRALGRAATVDIDAPLPAADDDAPAAKPDNLAYVIYTSGSTGRPKGACLAHAGVVNRLVWMQREYPIGPGDAVLQKTPFSFDVSVWELFWALMTGARLVMAEPGGHRDAAYLAATIREHEITVVHFVPSMLAQFLQEPAVRGITSLRHVVCSGEALPSDVAQRAMELLPGTLENLYGPTEASVDVSYHRCDPVADTATVPIGRPVANTGLHVLTDDFSVAADGEAGELYLGGIQLARGYHRRPGLTAQRFVPDPFGSGGRLYRTGDIAMRRPDGEIEYLGRTDHQVKINGFRIELDEIGVALRTHPAVHDAVVVAHTTAAGHQQLLGYLVLAVDRECPRPAGLREFLSRTLPAHMIPARYLTIEEIPLSLNGKIDRKQLPAPDDRVAAPDTAAGTDVERTLVGIWRGVLAGAGPDDDFLDLGGDSIVALTLVARARAAGLRITAEHILRHRTIRAVAELAEAVTAPDDSGPAVAAPGRDAGAVAAIAALDDVADVYPLTPLQAGMLFHSQYNDDATDYFQQSVLGVSGPFDPGVFAAAWRDVAGRHPALRSRVAWAGLDRPVQVVEHAVRTSVTVVEAADLDRVVAEDRQVGFDPAAAPPLRLTAVRLGERDWAVVLSHHHLVLDGWSMALVVRELVQRYREHALAEPADVTAGPAFRRYVDWIDRQDRERAATFWRDRLRGCAGPAPLPGNVGHDDAPDGVGEISVRLAGARALALRDRARAEGLTLNSVVHGLWGLLLARYGERQDVVFGSTFSGRPPELAEVDTTVGLFITTLPVRLPVPPGAELAQWLREVQWNLLQLQDFQHCSLPDIRAWSGVPAGQALFDTIVIGQNQPAPRAHDPATGLSISSHDTVTNTGYPLVLLVEEHGERIELLLRYQRSRFDEAAVRRIAGHVDAALAAFAADPGRRVGDVELITAEESASWPVFGAQVPEPGAGATIHGLVEATAHRVPGAVAVRGRDHELTFAELNTRANRLAHHLRERGAGPETLIGVCAHRTPELLVSLLAVLKAGGAYLPLAPDNPAERLATIIADAGLRYLIVDDDLRELVAGSGAELIAPGSGTDDRDPVPLSTPDNLAYVIYTSGSTGKPKGVAVTHRGVVNHLRWCLAQLPEDARGGAPVFSSYGFDLIVPSLYAPLLAGQPVRLLPDGLDAGELADQLAEGAPYSFIKLTPGLLELLAEHLSPERAARLARVLLVGGEAFPDRVRARWHRLAPDTAIVNHYGPTEVSVGCSSFRTGAEPAGTTLAPIGRPHRNQSTYLLDERLRPVPVGVPGEICVGGVGNARGYLDRPGLTAGKFVPDPFWPVPGARMYRTGDRAVRLPGGDLLFLGRRDGQVKIRGYRVELGEIERALSGHPDLRGAVVTAPADDTGRQRLVAYVVAAGHAPAPGELRSWLGDRLPPYLVPATYLVLDELPLTANGKVDRTALPVPEAIDRAVQREYAAPRGDTERVLAECWAHVLRVERVGVHDNFFELGGDSIMTLQVVAGARQAGLRISPKLIFRYPTVAQLAPQATPITPATPPRAAAKTGEWFPLAPIQRAFAERDLPDHHHYNQSVVLTLDDADPGRMAAALRALVAHSPALRTRFDLAALRQRVVDREDADLLWCRDFASTDAAALTAAADEVQSSLDIVAGPVVRAGLFRTGDGPDRLLLAVHHLVVDTLSWRSLIEDLAAAYEGAPFAAPTSSYQDWIASLDTLDVASAGPEAVPALPVDHDHGPDTVATAASVHVRLSEEDTERLLREVPRVHRVRVEDLVVTAAAKTLAQWSGGPAVLDVERHGRDGAADDLDLSRTVGWFTQVLPLRFDEPGLHHVKEVLRGLPAVGSTGPVSPVVVNYHGRVDRSIPDAGPFTVAATPLGAEKSAAYPRPRPIEIEAGVRDGVLHVEWIYPATRLRADTVRTLAEAFLAHLRELSAYCVANPGGHTPSDFPLTRLTQREVDHLAASGPGGSALEDVHPLTAMQEGLLFHSLLDPDDDMYLGRRTYRLDGRIDLDAFAQAWREVGRRHPILRSTIVWDGLAEPVQAVWADADVRVVDVVRTGGFDLAAAPPIEVALRPEGESVRVVLSYHHIIVDGWSVSTVVSEVMEVYQALLEGSTARPAPAPPFAQFVAWLARSDAEQARGYWRQTLGDLTGATPLPVKPPQVPGTSSGTVDVDLSPSLHEAVRGFLARAGLTLATLAQGAWASVLADRTGRDDVVFGATVAIRPGELADVGRMVGPLITTLPVRVRLAPAPDTRAWLTGLQGRHAELREHVASALTDIHRLTALPAGEQLFDTILVVENFPRPVIAGPQASLTAVREFERTGYPIVLGVIDADPIRVQVLYEQADCDPAFARDLAEDTVRAFARLCRS
ncbi:amino acid adenylation domain-containing protein [Amycolatopsis mediterranei]|uniref:amino acid adenylation domain-containing protein n=1 Tax=Amycolatopsis mediterranei TaxID=33910 RepID=UPI003421C2A8